MKSLVRRFPLGFLVAVTLLARAIAIYPMVFGTDPVARLYYSDEIFLFHWLPFTPN